MAINWADSYESEAASIDGEAEYTEEFVSFLEVIWGEGYLSPGGRMGSPERYREALAAAGFTALGLTNRNEWYREVAARELADLHGPLYE